MLDDGGEVDLDLGNYERTMDLHLERDNNITTGKIYRCAPPAFMGLSPHPPLLFRLCFFLFLLFYRNLLSIGCTTSQATHQYAMVWAMVQA